jgi:amino acid adenylation domain-containing protein
VVAGLCPADLAYVIYTSGSTGRPKGVAVEHGPAAAHLAATLRSLGITSEDRVLQFASASFDVSLEQVFFPLLAGATLVLRGPELWSTTEFGARVRSLGITVANLPPAYWQEVAAGPGGGDLAGVRLLLVGGDALPAAAAWAGSTTRLVNCYGPTEAVVTATAFEVGERRSGSPIVPIGRPLPGRAAYVLDAFGAPVPQGVVGELCLGGALLARGYLGRPDVTAERFVPDPFSGAGGRLYRTGDRVRWNAEGQLEFLGRADFQVKVRGFRVELGEIEARLMEHAGVREAVVVALEDAPGEKRLVAYWVGRADVEVEGLHTHLSKALPAYMVPAAYVRLDALPLTPSGKVDRKALPAPDGAAYVSRTYEAPVGEVEEALAAIWGDVLGVEQVGRWDHFFELGGHSLRAVQVTSRVRQVLGVEVPLDAVFEWPVLAELAREVARAGQSALPPIERVDRGGGLPASFAQRRLWFLEQLGGLGSAYHMPSRPRLSGALDREALRRALDTLVARHESLRTTFVAVNGEPEQRIAPAETSRFSLVEHDLREDPERQLELRRLAAAEANERFDLEHGPLIRGRLVRVADEEQVLLLTMHHIVSDAWSMDVLARELTALYAAYRAGEPNPLSPLPVQYADYAAWQRQWVDGEVLAGQAAYWRETLAGAPDVLALPTDRPRPARADYAGDSISIALDPELTASLKALSRRHGTTLFHVVLAGWAAVLSRLSGQTDVVIGTPTANRNCEEVEGLIGFFVNTLALRVDLSDAPSVAELLGRVKTRALEAQANQDIPFEQVVELVQPARSLAHSPLFQVMFAWQTASDGGGLELEGLEHQRVGMVSRGAQRTASHQTAKFDLTLALREQGGRVVGGVTYATALFERETVERHLGHLRTLLEAMVADEARAVDRLPMLPPAEWRWLVEEFNATATEYPREFCAHQQFERQAARAPDAVALVHEDQRLSYGELNARANRLAHHLRSLGVGPEVRVALCAERSVEMIVALVAVLKAGGAYVPLDPSYPPERLRFMLEDSAPRIVLVQRRALSEALGALFDGLAVPVLALDTDAGAWADRPATDPAPGTLASGHLAYVIYTSGSTGRPKGVLVGHGNLANLIAWHLAAFALTAEDRSSSVASVGFDAAVWEIWPPLSVGASLFLAPTGRDPEALLRRWAAQPLDVAFLPTPLAEFAAARGLLNPRLRALLVGGDQLRSLRPTALSGALVNNYGPTETTVVATSGAIAPGAPVHIGWPIANAQVYILDAHGAPVPVGVAGELYVGGAGVARGYLGRPALTAERFVADAFGAEPGARLYRTGDLARWRADGAIEFMGRTDDQVKVRGFRVEPGEIEAQLREHPAVLDAVVVAREDKPGDQRLVAYYVADRSAEAPSAERFRTRLAERLPAHMVPAAYLELEALPLTENGKVDRKALPAPDADAFGTQGYDAPRNEVERTLAGIWSELLGVERVGRNDEFFALGGHSLLAVRVVDRARRVSGIHITLADMFAHSTIASIATHLSSDGARAASDEAIAVRREGTQRPLFVVHDGTGSVAYVDALARHLPRDMPVYALPAVTDPTRDLKTVEGMATRLLRMVLAVAPAGPYRLAGWSFGGTLAYEIAVQLIGRGERVEFLGLFDTEYRPSGRRDVDPPADACGDEDRMALYARALTEYFAPVVPIPIHLFPAKDDTHRDARRGWGVLVPDRLLRVTPVLGAHLTMMQDQNVTALGAAVTSAVRRVDGGGPRIPEDDHSLLITLQYGKPRVTPLVCIPGAGGNVVGFTALAGCLGGEWPVHGLQPRGVDGDLLPHTSVSAAADCYLSAVRRSHSGPVHLLGHSFGGWVAFEMVQRLRAAGERVASLTIVDSEVPDDDPAIIKEHDACDAVLRFVSIFELLLGRSLEIEPDEIRRRDEAGRLGLVHERLVRFGLMPRGSVPEDIRGAFRTFSACLRTTYAPAAPYDGPVRLILLRDTRLDETENLRQFAATVAGWRRYAPNLTALAGNGNHMTGLQLPHVQGLAALLTGTDTLPSIS